MDSIKDNPNGVGVCLVSRSFYPVYAGAAIRFQRYAPGLIKRGVNVQVFTQLHGSHSNGRPSTQASAYSNALEGLTIHRAALPKGWRGNIAFYNCLVEHCMAHKDEIDIVQFLPLDSWAFPWRHRLKQAGFRILATETMVAQPSDSPLRNLWRRNYRKLRFSQVDEVVVSTSAMQRSLEAFGVSRPIQIIGNGVNLQNFHPVQCASAKASLRQELGLAPEWQVILAVGPVRQRKGTDVLVEAFARLARQHSNARLVVVGPRHDLERPEMIGFRQKLERTINEAEIKEKVIFTGVVNNVHKYMQAADIFVFPSHR
ncbi:MAG: glycosyltransferase, partial [Ardenticatenaceae bacterium]